MNEELLINVWSFFKGFLDKNQISVAASTFVDIMVDNGMDDDHLKLLRGEDDDLDEAISYFLDDQEEHDQESDD